jgi:hypothetical protein
LSTTANKYIGNGFQVIGLSSIMSPVPNLDMQQTVSGTSNGIQGVKHNTHRHDLSENLLHRVWRGSKDGTVTLAGVPTFENKYDEREWIKVVLFML